MSDSIDRLDEQERREMLDWQRDELTMRDCALTPETKAPITTLAADDVTEQRCAGCGKWVNTQQPCRYCEQDLNDMRKC